MTKKHWSEKKDYCIKHIKGFWSGINEENLQWFLEEHVPNEDRRIRKKFFDDSQSGKIVTKYTPTDVVTPEGEFKTIKNPIIGGKYHLSWAFRGAVFILKLLDDDGIHCYLDNPKNKRKTLLKSKVSDLRSLRKH